MTNLQERTIGILGIGNLLLGDEGFGVHCVQHIEQHYEIPENIRVIDGGTAGILLAPFIEECDKLYVLDVIDLEDDPGSVHLFTDEDVRAGDVQTRMSPHQIGMLEILDICKIRGKVPEQVQYITVVPQTLETGMELSPLIAERVTDVIDILLQSLAKLSVSLPEKK
jgi:hydrogenase maturation protease